MKLEDITRLYGVTVSETCAVCTTELHVAVTVMVYVPAGVPGLPLPPPLPCRPPPQEITPEVKTRDKNASTHLRISLLRLGRFRQINPAIGKAENSIARIELRDAAIAAVVPSVKLTAEFSLPEPTWFGLKLQVASAGNLEHAKVTFFGNDPVVGFTSRLKIAG